MLYRGDVILPRNEGDGFKIPIADDKLRELINLILDSNLDIIIPNMIDFVLKDKDLIEAEVNKFKEDNPGVSNKDMATFFAKKKIGLATWLGAAAGVTGVIPGVGTVGQVAISATSAMGEAAYLFYLDLRLIFSIARIYGYDLNDDQRKIEAYHILALHSGLASVSKPFATRLGSRVTVKTFNKNVSGAFLRKINQKLGTTVLTKFGTKRGAVAVGRLIPFGVGITVGALINRFAIKKSADWAIRYYDRILPGGSNITITKK